MGKGTVLMFPLGEVMALLHQLDALGWLAQVVALALLLACYFLLLWIARRIGRRNIADLEDENAALKQQVAESSVKRRELRDEKLKLEKAVENLRAQRPEARLVRAAKEREHGNEELAIQLYQEIIATFSPDLARCCESLAVCGGDEPEVERYRTLAMRLADMGIRQ